MGVPVGPGAGFGRGVGGATTAGTIAAGVMVDTPGRLGGIDRVGSMGPFCASKSLLRIIKSDSNKIFRESVQNRLEIRGDILVYFYFYCGSGFGNYDMSQF